jgi:TetR/AcrR family transcriptional regulator, cholesterol catabolism regulator
MSELMQTASPERTAERVLREGAKLFREQGYAAATTRELARRLGINKASLYYHVAKKEDLLHQICVVAMAQIYEAVSAAVESESDPAERVRALIGAHLHSTLSELDMHATMMLEMKYLTGQRREEVMDARNRFEGLVGSTVAAAQRAGVIRHDMPASYLRILLLNLLNWPLTWYVPGAGMTPEKLNGYTYELYMNGAHPRVPEAQRARGSAANPVGEESLADMVSGHTERRATSP